MAVPSNTTQKYTRVGIREDLGDLISNVDPIERPFVNSVGKTTAKQTLHEWQTDTYRAAAANAKVEGDDYSNSSRGATVRPSNHCQIIGDATGTSGTARAVVNAGRGDEHDYQVAKIAMELQRDQEFIALRIDQAKGAGSASTARTMGTLGSWIATNTNLGSSGAAPTGDGSDNITAGTDRAVAESQIRDIMSKIFTSTGRLVSYMAFMNAALKSKVSTAWVGLAATNVQYPVKVSNQNMVSIVAAADAYHSDFGDVALVPDVFMPAKTIHVINPELWAFAYLRGLGVDELAKTGDADRDMVLMEVTLEAINQKGNGIITAVDPAL